jgi:hypothetical protein
MLHEKDKIDYTQNRLLRIDYSEVMIIVCEVPQLEKSLFRDKKITIFVYTFNLINYAKRKAKHIFKN